MKRMHHCDGVSRHRGELQCRVLQKGLRSAGYAGAEWCWEPWCKGQTKPKSIPGATSWPWERGMLRPALPPLGLLLSAWGSNEQKQLLLHLHPNWAADQHFCLITDLGEGEKCKRKSLSIDSLLCSLLTALPPSTQTMLYLLAESKQRFQPHLASGRSSTALSLESNVGPDCIEAVWTPDIRYPTNVLGLLALWSLVQIISPDRPHN